jgi:hypothetical protein
MLTLRQRLANLLDGLGLPRHPTKGLWPPSQVGHHIGIDMDTTSGYVYAPESKLVKIAQQAKQLVGRATRNARLLPVEDRQSLSGPARCLFLAIPAPRLFLRELQSVVNEKRGVGSPRPANITHASRHAVVDKNSHSIKRQAHPQACRDRILAHGQLGLRMGRGLELAPRGSWILERRERATTH